MAFRVSVTPEAELDAEEILIWLQEQEAGEAGLRWFKGLVAAIASLNVMPERGALALENRSFPFELRQLLYGNRRRYRILYTIEGNTVFILRIRRPGAAAADFALVNALPLAVVSNLEISGGCVNVPAANARSLESA